MRRFPMAYGALMLAVLLLLVGCGQTTAHNTDSTVIATNTPDAPQPTATVQPTPNETPGVVDSGHPCTTDTSGQTQYVQIGDLQVSTVRFSLAYPANELASTLDATKPARLADNLPNPPNPPVNPATANGFGYGFTICNTSRSHSHVLRSITSRIAAFSAYNGTLNTYMFCDTFYQRPNGVAGGGCGGGITFDESLQAVFAANATPGARVNDTQIAAPNAPPLPVILGPGQMLDFSVGVTPPTTPGLYSITVGVSYDLTTAATISTVQPTLFDSAAVKWNGDNCNTPAMLSQIPANSTGKYVCAPHS
jgi:hypothetical protein